jgi:hypothetical protein
MLNADKSISICKAAVFKRNYFSFEMSILTNISIEVNLENEKINQTINEIHTKSYP